MLGFDGNLNTGLTLRTVRIANGIAEVRAGATLLFDSEPAAEERETELKASAMRDAVLRADPDDDKSGALEVDKAGSSAQIPPSLSAPAGPRVLLVDHQDSFVHTLANYLRQTGAVVTTLRSGFAAAALDKLQPALVVLSPGPGCARAPSLPPPGNPRGTPTPCFDPLLRHRRHTAQSLLHASIAATALSCHHSTQLPPQHPTTAAPLLTRARAVATCVCSSLRFGHHNSLARPYAPPAPRACISRSC